MLNCAAYVLLCICTFLQKSTIISNNKKNKIVSPLFFLLFDCKTLIHFPWYVAYTHFIFYYHLALRVMGAAGAYPGCPQVLPFALALALTRTANIHKFTIQLACISLYCGRKPVYLERTTIKFGFGKWEIVRSVNYLYLLLLVRLLSRSAT